MKHANLIFLLAALFCLPSPAQGQVLDTIQSFYPDGRPALWRTTLNGQAEGEWLEWYPNGFLRYRAMWRNDKGHGLWEYFHPNGQLRSEAVYIDDLATGLDLEYYDNGQLARKTTYMKGRKHGPETFYQPSGKVDHVNYYDDGKLQVRTPKIYSPGVLSDPIADEYGIAFGPDMRTAYITRRYPGEKQRIYISNYRNGSWSNPEVASFSTNRDEGATLSEDGKTLIFASYRSVGDPIDEEARMDMNLWVTRKNDAGWSVAVPLAGGINQPRPKGTPWAKGYETGPYIAGDKLYYWSAGKEGNDPDVLVSTLKKDGEYGPGVEVPGINTAGSESGAAVSPDGQYLVFSAYGREEGFGGEDLYLSRKVAGKWGTPVNLGPIVNTVAEEGGARFSPDGQYLFFVRGAEEVQTDIYYISTAFLPGM